MGREEKFPVVPPKFTILFRTMRFALTNISLSANVENTVQTTRIHSPERLKRELQLISVECNLNDYLAHLWRLLPVYFPLSQPVNLIAVIICGIGGLSRLGKFSRLAGRLTVRNEAFS